MLIHKQKDWKMSLTWTAKTKNFQSTFMSKNLNSWVTKRQSRFFKSKRKIKTHQYLLSKANLQKKLYSSESCVCVAIKRLCKMLRIFLDLLGLIICNLNGAWWRLINLSYLICRKRMSLYLQIPIKRLKC